MKIFAYDTECNSLSTDDGFIQEVAWAVYDSETWRCLFAKSYLINWPTAYTVDPGALAVTGLTVEFCREFGRRPGDVFMEMLRDMGSSDVLCGHNAIHYDRPMLRTNIKRAMLFDVGPESPLENRLHIDTLLDCEYPSTMKIQSLRYLAYDHGFILSNAHQALADVFACAHLLKCYPLERTIEIAKTPVVKITSKIDWDNTEARERIKQARFYWNPTLKLWEKSIREFYVPGIQLKLGTDVQLNIAR